MKVNILNIRGNLKTIVLLGREYHEKVNPSEDEGARNILTKMHNGQEINQYERQFLQSVFEAKQVILNQINFFAKKLIDEFDVDGQLVLDIDQEKVDYILQKLTPYEKKILVFLYQLQVREQHLENPKKGVYKKLKIEDIDEDLSRLVQLASSAI